MLRKAMIAAVFAAALGAAACDSYGPTPYQPGGGSERGYSETKIENDRYRISFKGNSLTDKETVETYLLYRAAELTVENGYEWFAAPSPSVNEEVEIAIEVERPDAYRARYWRPHWRQRSRFFWSDVDPAGPMPPARRETQEPRVWNNAHYSASADIVMGNGPPPVGAFDARETLARLGPLIIRP